VIDKNFRTLSRDTRRESEFRSVSKIALSLLEYLRSKEIAEKIAKANRKGVSSSDIQACIASRCEELGFQSEKQGLFSEYAIGALRPDYYLKLSPGRGIVLEVEKGKTLTNNMDILDLWKCHICASAQYLFLLVPIAAQNAGQRNVFDIVVRRMEPFFCGGNYVSVEGLFIFGY
jgi:hypothetical protein